MKIKKLARRKLADKSVSWEEIYTPDTAYFKAMYDDILGEGSYFRFEGKDSETGDWHMVVVAPAKMHDPESQFFAGQRKLPSTYSASGEYFSDLKQALNHADNNWGVSFPSDANLALSSKDLKGIKEKADEWRKENKKEDVVAKFDKNITDPKTDPKSASSKGSFIKLSMAEKKFRNRPSYRYFDLDELDKAMPADWDAVVAAWPNISVELEYARGLRKNIRDELISRYGQMGANPEMHKMYLANCPELDDGVPEQPARNGKPAKPGRPPAPWGSNLISVGPYVGTKFSDGAANTFCTFQQSLTVYESAELQRTIAKAMNEYQQEYGVVLNPQDFSLPKMTANKFLQHFVALKASGKEKILAAAARTNGIPAEGEGWKSAIQERLEAQQRTWLQTQHPTLDLSKLTTKQVNQRVFDSWESWREATARGENIPKPPMLNIEKFGNGKYTEGAQRPSGIIKHPAFKVVGTIAPGTRTITVAPSIDGQDLKRIGTGSVIKLSTFNKMGDYRHSKNLYVVESFIPEEGGQRAVMTVRTPIDMDKEPPTGEDVEDWKKEILVGVKQRVDVIEGHLVDWSLDDDQIAQRTGFTVERVERDRPAYEAMHYGFNDMQAAFDLAWRTKKYLPQKKSDIPGEPDGQRIVVTRNFTKTDLEAFANIRTQETVEASPDEDQPEDLEVQPENEVPETGEPQDDFKGEFPEEFPEVPESSPEKGKGKEKAKTVTPVKAPLVQPETITPPSPPEEEEDFSEFEDFLKQHNVKKGSFVNSVGGISSIASDLEKMGKFKAAEEVRKMLHKYL